MRRAVAWLFNAWGRDRAEPVRRAYRSRLGADDADARLILSDLARYCNVGNTSFVPGQPETTHFNEGQRDVFCHVAEMLGLRPEDFPQLLEDDHDD
jgi:hypothetical protein